MVVTVRVVVTVTTDHKCCLMTRFCSMVLTSGLERNSFSIVITMVCLCVWRCLGSVCVSGLRVCWRLVCQLCAILPDGEDRLSVSLPTCPLLPACVGPSARGAHAHTLAKVCTHTHTHSFYLSLLHTVRMFPITKEVPSYLNSAHNVMPDNNPNQRRCDRINHKNSCLLSTLVTGWFHPAGAVH